MLKQKQSRSNSDC